jgi:hypothetical protein
MNLRIQTNHLFLVYDNLNISKELLLEQLNTKNLDISQYIIAEVGGQNGLNQYKLNKRKTSNLVLLDKTPCSSFYSVYRTKDKIVALLKNIKYCSNEFKSL